MEKIINFLKKIPFSAVSVICLAITYFVAGTIGMLVIPVILCIIFVLPVGIVFAILDIVIRKKAFADYMPRSKSLSPYRFYIYDM